MSRILNARMRIMIGIAVLMTVSFMFVACNKNSGSNNSPAMAYPYGMPGAGCVGCPGNMGYLMNAIASGGMITPMEMGLDFFGDGSRLAQYGSMSSYPQGYLMGGTRPAYSGPFAVTGYLFIAQPIYMCPYLPPGQYALQTVQPGIFGLDGMGRAFDQVMVNASGGPMQIRMLLSGQTMPSVPPSVGSRDGRSYQFRFVATTLVVMLPNGMSCDLSLLLQ